jgi:hypothetical protein
MKMVVNSPNGRRRGVRRWLGLAAAAVLAVGLVQPLGSGPVAADTPRVAVAGGRSLPGLAPGEAVASLEAGVAAFDNAVLGVTFAVGETGAGLTRLENKQTGQLLPVVTNKFFSMTLSSGAVVGDADFELASGPELSRVAADPDGPRVADRAAGWQVAATWLCDSAGFELSWVAELRDDGNSVEQFFTIIPTAGSTVAYRSTSLLNLSGVANPVRGGSDSGNPAIAGGSAWEDSTFFFGLENPSSTMALTGSSVVLSLARTEPLVAGAARNASVTESVGIGVSVEGQMRRAFGYYVERERCHERRQYVQYESWYDITYEDDMRVGNEEFAHSIEVFGEGLTSRGAPVASFHVDDGWDYIRDPQVADESGLKIWSVDPTEFPDGFDTHKELAGDYGAELSVWMSPNGGYNPARAQRLAFNASLPQPYNITLTDSRYYEAFRERVFDMIENQGVNGFKFDGVSAAQFEASLALNREIREHSPDVFIYETIGTYPAPYWLWYVDCVWRDGVDTGTAGTGSNAQKYVTYRDMWAIATATTRNPLFPSTALMYVGFVWSSKGYARFTTPSSWDLTQDPGQAELRQAAKAFWALGSDLQDMYVDVARLDNYSEAEQDFFWDTVAENVKWSQENFDLLADTRYIGKSHLGVPYATAAWSGAGGGEGILMVRNPSASTQSFKVDPEAVFEIPERLGTRYKFTERDADAAAFVADRYRPYEVEVGPYEVLIFHAAPTTEAVTTTWVPSSAAAASFKAMDRTGWTASASDAETVDPGCEPANVLDANPGTIWHTQYKPSAAPMPHWISIDMGSSTEVAGLAYTGRQTGTNGMVKDYTVEVSADGEDWSPPVAAGVFANTKTAQQAVFEEPVVARHVRLNISSNHSGDSFAAVGDIQLLTSQVALSRAGWGAFASDAEGADSDGRAVNAIDGDLATIWHSQYGGSATGGEPYPHWIVVDTRQRTTWDVLELTSRADGGVSGVIKDVKIQVSDDAQDWEDVAEAVFARGVNQVVLEEPVVARYVRVYATSAVVGMTNPNAASAAEINLYNTSGLELGGPVAMAVADPALGAVADLQIGVDGTGVEPGGDLVLSDIPRVGAYQVGLQPGSIALGWVRGDEDQTAVVALPVGLAPGQYAVVVQDQAERVAGLGSIVVEDPAPPSTFPDVSASVAFKCAAGKVYMAVTLVNEEDGPVALELSTPFGSKSFASVASGKKQTASFNTLTGNLSQGGKLTLKASAGGGDPVAKDIGYGTHACGQ